MKTLILSLLLLSAFIYIDAQTIENTINGYGTNFPQEKMHIHFDKESYLAGETIWFKAYVFEENLPSERSTNFYAALYDENGKLIQQQLCPIFNATCDGHFDIPDSLKSKQLIYRAYTSWMLNFDISLLFTKLIKIIAPSSATNLEQLLKTTSIQFYPEGGDLIEGTRNTIAFMANYTNGLPFEIDGMIKQETGEEIAPIKSLHDGMGRFDLEIEAGKRYYAEWKNEKGEIKRTYLPKAKPVGVSLKMVLQKNNLVFNLTNKSGSDSLHVLMYLYQKVFYKVNLSVSAEEPYTGIVPTNTLPTGTMQLTVFDGNWQPVAERIAFINNGNYSMSATINAKEISLQKRTKNTIEIEVADTINSNMSLSITDAGINNGEPASIVSGLLFSGDVKGFIYKPEYYFLNADAAAKMNLDLVMLTHGWRRYNWDDMRAGKFPSPHYPPDNYLTVKAQVGKSTLSKIIKDEKVNVFVRKKDSTSNFYSVRPDGDGIIYQPGLIFYDSAKVMFSFNKSKKFNNEIGFSKSNFTVSPLPLINNYSNYMATDINSFNAGQAAALLKYSTLASAERQFNQNKTLKTITVKSSSWQQRKNNALSKMEDRYTDTYFRSSSGISIDVMHDEMAGAKMDVYNFMMGKVPSLAINYTNGGKSFKSNDNKDIVTFIDGRAVENDELSQLNIGDVAFVKYIETYGGQLGFPHGIAFYLKKGTDLIDWRPNDAELKQIKIGGYSPIKEFYSPDYSESNTSPGPDTRTTLLWIPYIITNSAGHKIPVTFYNNDFSKKLRVVVEGINDEGKMLHIEKIIE